MGAERVRLEEDINKKLEAMEAKLEAQCNQTSSSSTTAVAMPYFATPPNVPDAPMVDIDKIDALANSVRA